MELVRGRNVGWIVPPTGPNPKRRHRTQQHHQQGRLEENSTLHRCVRSPSSSCTTVPSVPSIRLLRSPSTPFSHRCIHQHPPSPACILRGFSAANSSPADGRVAGGTTAAEQMPPLRRPHVFGRWRQAGGRKAGAGTTIDASQDLTLVWSSYLQRPYHTEDEAKDCKSLCETESASNGVCINEATTTIYALRGRISRRISNGSKDIIGAYCWVSTVNVRYYDYIELQMARMYWDQSCSSELVASLWCRTFALHRAKAVAALGSPALKRRVHARREGPRKG